MLLDVSLKLLRNSLALILLVVATAYAQGGPGGQRPQGPPSPAMQLEQLVRVMSEASMPFSDAQQSSILLVYQDGVTAAKADSSSASSDEAIRREQMQALQASVRKAVRAQLSDAQARVFDAMRQPGLTGGNGVPPHGGPPSS